MRSLVWLVLLLALGAGPVTHARAHFKLLSPASWITEGSSGDPQKTSPCGPGAGDSASMTGEVTTVHAGDELMVEIEETIHHPGWFRISLDSDRSKFEEIKFPNANCTYDMSTVSTEPHGNVLKDGFAMDTSLAGANRKLMEKIKIPDQPCEKCTLQVIQVMADTIHAPPGCIYYHCADLKILPAMGSTGAGGSSAAGSAAGTTGNAGAGAAGTASAAGAGAAGMTGSSAGASGPTTAQPSAAGSGTAGKPSTTPGSTSNPATATAGSSAGRAAASAGTAAPAVSGAAVPPPAPAAQDDGGCSVTHVASSSRGLGLATCLIMGVVFLGRARRAGRRPVRHQART